MKLPIELFRAITDEVDTAADLLSIRAATKVLHSLATPRAFRSLRVSNTPKSTEGFTNLLKAGSIAVYVVEVVFHDADPVSEPFDEVEKADIAQVETAFGMLGSLPNLSTLELSLHPYHSEDDFEDDFEPSPRLLTHFAILRGLCSASDKLSLTSLSILNLLPYNPDDGFYERPSFARIFLSLQKLHISVITDGGGSREGTFPSSHMMRFWDTTFQPGIFNPSAGFAPTLTSLTLEADIDVGDFPGFNWAELNYPQLTSLSLTSFMFVDPSGLEDFIIRHRAMLRYLMLKNSTIPIIEGNDGPSRHWAEVWNRFAEELTSLEELIVESKTDTRAVPPRALNYAYYGPGSGYMTCSDEIPGDEGDAEALEAFKAVVKSRRL